MSGRPLVFTTRSGYEPIACALKVEQGASKTREFGRHIHLGNLLKTMRDHLTAHLGDGVPQLVYEVLHCLGAQQRLPRDHARERL